MLSQKYNLVNFSTYFHMHKKVFFNNCIKSFCFIFETIDLLLLNANKVY